MSVTLMRMRSGALVGAIHDDRSPLFVVFDRVGKQVDDNLLQPGPVGPDKEADVEPGKGHADATLLRLRLHHGLAFGHDLGQRHRLRRQRHLPGLDHREIEDFVDQLQQMPSRLENLGDAFRLGVRRQRESADSINWAKPRIALSGLRSSWLMLERKSDLARLAFSATDLALSSSTFFSCST